MTRSHFRLPVGPTSDEEVAAKAVQHYLPLGLMWAITNNLPNEVSDSIFDTEMELNQAPEPPKGMSLRRNGALIEVPFGHLDHAQLPWSDEEIRNSGMNPDDVQLLMGRFDRETEISRAYCGWLLLSEEFLQEHDELLSQWTTSIARHGIPRMALPVTDPRMLGAVPADELPVERDFVEAFSRFYIRWRLKELVAPYLPWPVGKAMPIADARLLLPHILEGGTAFFIPDTSPLPDRDELRRQIEEAVRSLSEPPAHLRGWMDIVAADNARKSEIGTHARKFLLIHYWTVLFDRHADTLDGQIQNLHRAFAQFFGTCQEESIRKDLKAIRGVLGADWFRAT